jgi:hypothetical protein
MPLQPAAQENEHSSSNPKPPDHSVLTEPEGGEGVLVALLGESLSERVITLPSRS